MCVPPSAAPACSASHISRAIIQPRRHAALLLAVRFGDPIHPAQEYLDDAIDGITPLQFWLLWVFVPWWPIKNFAAASLRSANSYLDDIFFMLSWFGITLDILIFVCVSQCSCKLLCEGCSRASRCSSVGISNACIPSTSTVRIRSSAGAMFSAAACIRFYSHFQCSLSSALCSRVPTSTFFTTSPRFSFPACSFTSTCAPCYLASCWRCCDRDFISMFRFPTNCGYISIDLTLSACTSASRSRCSRANAAAASAHAPSNACLCSYTYASIFWMSSDAIVKLKDN